MADIATGERFMQIADSCYAYVARPIVLTFVQTFIYFLVIIHNETFTSIVRLLNSKRLTM